MNTRTKSKPNLHFPTHNCQQERKSTQHQQIWCLKFAQTHTSHFFSFSLPPLLSISVFFLHKHTISIMKKKKPWTKRKGEESSVCFPFQSTFSQDFPYWWFWILYSFSRDEQQSQLLHDNDLESIVMMIPSFFHNQHSFWTCVDCEKE